jgi:hypothetical protein
MATPEAPPRFFTLVLEPRPSGWTRHARRERKVLYHMLLEILRAPCLGYRLRGEGVWNDFCIHRWRQFAIVYVFDPIEVLVEVIFAGIIGKPSDPLRRLREYLISLGHRDTDLGHDQLPRFQCCDLSEPDVADLLEHFGSAEPTRLRP